ncbi:hypothetical protein [Cupriavidus taiwanensis]|uniref:Immunity protein 72 domain-containing protein n=1 Tax=Cupriavidus taiwanensis TaxID=164546 RepID=A0A7Z7JFQ0_9BURK|nr:hypothetical protein [Cupriavidus taiwanensis]SOY73549.1 conserved hypothetical protein [Cupriavidus taiwanensis]SOZ10327.1 conserved protein of unknown function [Cupriavidus taiwanensis]SOZ12497.1 conserved protein of unknown function [Cupriavidus taiwanensis]SOZ43802.1 conserved protein of unknown function [Cupriavidus taiwanensis]SPC23044.1 conserved protein of unknown function [Cupriavidus taiwanensis]
MSKQDSKAYDATRNIDQDAWFLYQTAAVPYYELCAQLCLDFAELYNGFITGHGLHGEARLDYWVSRYLSHADNIRRGIKLIQDAGDYMPMKGFLNAPATDYRGLVEQPLGWMTTAQRKCWDEAFDRLSTACATGATTLRNNEWCGQYWLERDRHKHEYELVDRDDGHTGDLKDFIQSLAQQRLIVPPASYPHHHVKTAAGVSPGTPCPQTGVWVPSQWLQGARDFSLAFCVQGRPMQPAFQLRIGKPYDILANYDLPEDDDADSGLITTLETTAVDTTWFFVEQPKAQQAASDDLRHLRCEANEPCPRSGYWLTPAKTTARRYFRAGETMPDVASDYGATIWQWDVNQLDPKL